MLSSKSRLLVVLALWAFSTEAFPAPSSLLESKRSIDASKTYIIMDNDWVGPSGFLPALIGLAAKDS